MRELLVVYCKGFSMGSADVVPGVSGATIALIVGIYDRLIAAITAIDPRRFGAIRRVHEPEGRAALQAELERIDAPFLLALGLGIATAIVTLSRVMHVATAEYPVPTYGFFFGLIAASAIVLYGEIDEWTAWRVAVSVAAVVFAAAVTGVTAGATSHGPAMVFFAGAIAICAMILPGVSGSFFLLVLGQYEYMTGTLSRFVDGVLGALNGDPLAPVVETGTVVAIFGVGAVLGLFTMAHVVRRALDRYRQTTLAFLVSLMVGALGLPIARIEDGLGVTPGGTLGVALFAAVVGAAAVLLVDRYTDDLEY
ncbi:DUF368 domain-containing protein [Halosolutus gelatinilyticus]|uniref:DUF368 domain-containing protein n=1 Tax=Halosolutus gelatinilyticus TaxID=2931975 RepID=UPI001FF1DE12|nr:DUF368 domain-containing protein [Halosolutus gelatinilyticus]